ncbi:hypothetical protein HK101_007960 [Irineochytrium annulatum]|nr:hypothetical protein HK101_007960 [Irineochytrium annulatum]
MSSLFYLSVPASPTKAEAVATLREKIASKSNDFAELQPFNLPEFKACTRRICFFGVTRILGGNVGTLDTLVVLSDDLAKTDATFESVALKISENMRGLLNNDLKQWQNNLVVNDKSIDVYLKSFQWNTMKYRIDKSLRDITDLITQEVNAIEALMKTKMQNYSSVKTQLTAMQRKQVGNLSVRNLNGVVKKEHFVLDSEYLTTVLVAVPKALEKEWFGIYESLTQMVVPRSSIKITEDDDYVLFNVTLFQRVVDEFTLKAREHKFVVRDFKWNEQQMATEKKELAEAGASEKELLTTLLRLCKTNFGEVFACWIHVKVVRLYVESILRYGLPPDFQPMLIRAKPKHEQRVRDIINQLYAKLGGAANNPKGGDDEHLEENLQQLLGDKDYCPVVLFPLNTFWVV